MAEENDDELDLQLWKAVIKGDVDEVKKCLANEDTYPNFVNPDETENESGRTPLHLCAVNNRSDIATLLIRAGGHVNIKDSNEQTPLHVCALNNSSAIAVTLLKARADINIKDGKKNSPLHLCALKNSSDTADVLLKFGADVNIKDGVGRTALHWCAYNNSPEAAGVLLKAGAHVNVKDWVEATPLHTCSDNNNPAVAQLILSAPDMQLQAKNGAGLTALDIVREQARNAPKTFTKAGKKREDAQRRELIAMLEAADSSPGS